MKELHIAPMVHYTDRDFRAFLRILSTRTVTWTEMIADNILLKAPQAVQDFHLARGYGADSSIVCQIGTNDPDRAYECVKLIFEHYPHFQEVNLNAECPSNKVAKEEGFGAALMKDPDLMVAIIKRMIEGADGDSSQISIKMRIGVDDQTSFDFLSNLIRRLTTEGGCRRYFMHARPVFLDGLNARQNRNIPPLDYRCVFKLCDLFPQCSFWLNGHIQTLTQAKTLSFGTRLTGKQCTLTGKADDNATAPVKVAPSNLMGCMMGRAALENVGLFGDADVSYFGLGQNPCTSRHQALERYVVYLDQTYPRRCCDDDDVITYKYPPPPIKHTKLSCSHCSDFRTTLCEVLITTDDPPIEGVGTTEGTTNDTQEKETIRNEGKESFQKRCPGVKISKRLIGDSLKPVYSLFAGLPDSKMFRKNCDTILKESPELINCGPGTVLWSVMRKTNLPHEILRRPFSTK